MNTHLDTILAATRAAVTAAKARVTVSKLESMAAEHQPRGWAAALRKQVAIGPAVIAEIKKASPSKGLIRADFDVEWLARRYQAGGAAALSVLTDEPFFQGSLRNLELASKAVKLPCLRKDFMVDEFQILEARANAADAILLIVAALSDAELRTLRNAAKRHGLDVLCEVHDQEELDRALALDCECVGVNSRDLRTFEVSLDRACELATHLPASAVRVAESGIHTPADMQRLRAAGYEAFLIGESLMRKPHPGEALTHLLYEAAK